MDGGGLMDNKEFIRPFSMKKASKDGKSVKYGVSCFELKLWKCVNQYFDNSLIYQ